MKFSGKNMIELFTTITVSTGDTTKAFAYDRDKDTKWSSSGSDDTTTESYEVVWAAAKTIDAISLLNHNLKQYTVQYWDGAAYADFSTPITETVNTATSNRHSFTAVSTLKVKLTATKTHVANAQKYVGEFIANDEVFDIEDDYIPDNEDRDEHYRQSEHEKVNGGSVIVIEATRAKYWNVFNFNNLRETHRDNLKALKNTHSSFWFMPDEDVAVDQFYVNMIGFKFNKTDAWTATGERCYKGYFEVKET